MSDPRKPIPDPRACEEAEHEIDKLLDAVAAKRDAAVVASACAKRAAEVTAGSAVHYCLLGRARDQALEAGAIRLALTYAVEAVDAYRLDRFATLATIAETARKGRGRQQDRDAQDALLRFGVEWCRRAVAARELPPARRLLAVAEACSRRPDLREFGSLIRQMAADLTQIERFDPGRATSAQLAKLLDTLVRCCSPARSIEAFARHGGSSLGEVARHDQEIVDSVDQLLGNGAAAASTGARRRSGRGGAVAPALSDEVREEWLAKCKGLASRWAALAADAGLGALSADVCRARAGEWFGHAIAFAGNDVERLQLTTALAELTKPQTQRTYLADHEPKQASDIPFGLQRGDTAVFGQVGNPIRIKGVAHARSVVMHALDQKHEDGGDYVWARFVVPPQASSLRGAVAINDSGGTRTEMDPLVFEIRSGEHLLWWSRPILSARVSEEFVVPVRAGSLVELRVRSTGKGAYGQAIWIDPYYLR